MTMVTLADALERALASMLEGYGTVGAVPDACELEKGADAKPAQVREEIVSCDTALPAKEDYANTCSPADSKGARPTLAAGRHMFTVIEGGRTEQREGTPSVRRYARASGKASELGWSVHVASPH